MKNVLDEKRYVWWYGGLRFPAFRNLYGSKLYHWERNGGKQSVTLSTTQNTIQPSCDHGLQLFLLSAIQRINLFKVKSIIQGIYYHQSCRTTIIQFMWFLYFSYRHKILIKFISYRSTWKLIVRKRRKKNAGKVWSFTPRIEMYLEIYLEERKLQEISKYCLKHILAAQWVVKLGAANSDRTEHYPWLTIQARVAPSDHHDDCLHEFRDWDDDVRG